MYRRCSSRGAALRGTHRSVVAAVLSVSLVFAGCSDDNESEVATTAVSSAETSTVESEEPTTIASSESSTVASEESLTTTASSEPTVGTGEPLKIMTIGDFAVSASGDEYPEVSGAVEARVEAINAAGGINGRPVEVVVCNTNLDPNQAAQCARDAVEEEVVAVVGNFTALDSQIYPVLEAAGIPSIGPVPAGGAESLTSKVSFPILSGIPGVFFGMPRLAVERGAKTISLMYPDLPQAAQSLPLIEGSLGLDGRTLQNTVPIALDSPDVTPAIASLIGGGTDGVIGFGVGDQNGAILQALKQQGYQGSVTTIGTFLTPELIESLGDTAEGVYVVITTVTTDADAPGVEMFRSDMESFDGGLALTDTALAAWAATWLFERVAMDLPEVTSAALLESMGNIKGLDMGGITPPLDTTKEFTTLPIPRIFNPTVVYTQIKDGKLVMLNPADPFTNPFEP